MNTIKSLKEKVGLLILQFISVGKDEKELNEFIQNLKAISEEIKRLTKSESMFNICEDISIQIAKLKAKAYTSEEEFEELCEQIAENIEKLEEALDKFIKESNTEILGEEVKEEPVEVIEEKIEEIIEKEPSGKEKDESSITGDRELTIDFIEDSIENLESAEACLVELEKNYDDIEGVNKILRVFHSIKGESGFLRFDDIIKISHKTEDLLEAIRNKEISINSNIIDLLFKMVDIHKNAIKELILDEEDRDFDITEFAKNIKVIDEIVAGIEVDKEVDKEVVKEKVEQKKENEKKSVLDSSEFIEDVELINDFISESIENLENAELNVIKLEEDPGDKESINTVFRAFHTIKGVAGFLGFENVVSLSHATEDLLDKIRNNEITLNSDIIDVVFKMIDLLKKAIKELVLEEKDREVDDTVTEQYLQMIKDVFEGKTWEEEGLAVAEAGVGEKVKEHVLTQKSKKETVALAHIKVSAEKLDFLIDMIGELVICSNMIKGDQIIKSIKNINFEKKLSQLTDVVRALQDGSLSLRMVPIGDTFKKMNRIVRDQQRKSKKNIQLILKGEETEIDRNIVNQLYDPLVHMIRNSCDHGIESPSVRKKKGKKEAGKIILNAYHKGNNINIEIKDDGAGLDKETILKKAISKGLINENSQLQENEIFKLIMNPGFSTAKKITDTSGRGVGMDVVDKGIKKLNGVIEIESEKDKGSIFTLKVPLTLAIIQGLIVKIGVEKLTIPVANIKQSIKPKKEEVNNVAGGGETVNQKGELIPIIRLYKKFYLKNANKNPWEATLVIVETEQGEFALMVDEVIDLQETVVKPLGGKFRNIPGISGGTIMSDGNVGLIVDVNKIDI